MGGSLPEMGDWDAVTGVDRSEIQLAEAERRRGDAAWPRLLRADYRELPFADSLLRPAHLEPPAG